MALDASSSTTQRVRVWDLATRAFHWLLVGLVVFLFVSGKTGGNRRANHLPQGYGRPAGALRGLRDHQEDQPGRGVGAVGGTERDAGTSHCPPRVRAGDRVLREVRHRCRTAARSRSARRLPRRRNQRVSARRGAVQALALSASDTKASAKKASGSSLHCAMKSVRAASIITGTPHA